MSELSVWNVWRSLAQVERLVSTAVPVEALGAFVTAETRCVLLRRRFGPIGAEVEQALGSLATARLDVCGSGPVAGLAAALHERRARVLAREDLRVRGLLVVGEQILVARRAHLIADIAHGGGRLLLRARVNRCEEHVQ